MQLTKKEIDETLLEISKEAPLRVSSEEAITTIRLTLVLLGLYLTDKMKDKERAAKQAEKATQH